MKKNWMQIITLLLCLGLLVATIKQHGEILRLHVAAQIMGDLRTEDAQEINDLEKRIAELEQQMHSLNAID